jgi:preprotein translocase subunit SecD
VRRIRGLIVSLVFVGLLAGGSATLLATGTDPQLGLDLIGGVAVVLSAPEGTDRDVVDRALESIRDRVDALGVAEPSLQVVGERNIEVQIPGLAQGEIVERGGEFCVTSSAGEDLGCFPNRSRAEARLQERGQGRLLDLIGRTARLEFRELLQAAGPQDPGYGALQITCPEGETGRPGRGASPSPSPTPSGSPGASPSPSPGGSPGPSPTSPTTTTGSPGASPTPSPSPGGGDEPGIEGCSNEDLQDEEIVITGEPGAPDEQTRYRVGPARLVGGITRAVAVLDPGDGSACGATSAGLWCISFELDGEASQTFGQLTQELANRQLAIVLDRRVQSAPTVNQPITNGQGQITGDFDEDEAKDLAVVLKTGSLPVELTRESIETVSATLGQESLDQGLVAGIAGLIGLALYLAFYYRLLGLVTWLGMGVWTLISLAIIAILGEYAGYSLTLAGVAGLIVSLGVTADSYIVFYERLKDEVRKGKSMRVAVVPAFKRAWRTIIAADVVTILAAAILYLLAISSVRGFALTLGIATALDMFVVYFFKRPLVFLLARNDRLANLPGFGLRSGVAADPLPGDVAPVAGGSE